MKRFSFEQFASSLTKKRKPSKEDFATYVGLDHMDSGSLKITRWGSSVPIKGEKIIMRKGDVLLGKRNAYLRRAAVAPHDGLFSAHGMVLEPKTDIIEEDFFPLFIASDYFFDEAIRISVGSLSPTINWSDLKNLEFDLPEIADQRNIAKTLWSIIDTIESYNSVIKVLNKLLETKFISLFGDPLTATENPLPCVSLKSIFERPFNGEWGKDDDSNTGVPVIRTTNFTDEGYVNYDGLVTRTIESKILKKKSLKKGDILLEKSGGSTDKPVGRVVLFNGEENKYLNNNFTTALRLNGNYDLNYLFVFYFLFLNYWSGGTADYESKTTGIHNLHLSEFMDNTFIPLPNPSEQATFSDYFMLIDNTKKEITKSIAKLKSVYTNVLTNSFRESEE
jgi:type I restriction enzyme S subunit